MASYTINKQPIFTVTPVLQTTTFDPKIPDTLTQTGKATAIYTDRSIYGASITKITVCANAIVGDSVTQKRIYLMIVDESNSTLYNIYKTELMAGSGGGLPVTTTVPYVEFIFEQGLVIPAGKELAIAASTNREVTSFTGDSLIVTVEGGTYDLPLS